MKKISEIEANIEKYLNDDNLYGSFGIDDLLEMARMGEIPNTKYEIHIEGGEGPIPHIHICQKNGKNIVLRLYLLTNEYFREADDKGNILSSIERKSLDIYLKSFYAPSYGLTEWRNLCYMWNKFNPEHQIKDIEKLEQPTYTIINEPK